MVHLTLLERHFSWYCSAEAYSGDAGWGVGRGGGRGRMIGGSGGWRVTFSKRVGKWILREKEGEIREKGGRREGKRRGVDLEGERE